jgi:hypothetical protein
VAVARWLKSAAAEGDVGGSRLLACVCLSVGQLSVSRKASQLARLG